MFLPKLIDIHLFFDVHDQYDNLVPLLQDIFLAVDLYCYHILSMNKEKALIIFTGILDVLSYRRSQVHLCVVLSMQNLKAGFEK